jgi:hypothetical protein
MSQYLEVTDSNYVSAGTTLTASLILRASSIIDGYCKRELAVKSYTERVPLTDQQRGHLSYFPVIAITALKGRPRYGLTGSNIFGPPQLEPITDLTILDCDHNIGSLWCGSSIFGSAYSELEVTYTSGWAMIPDNVKVACGMIIDQLVNSNNSNVKTKKDFDFSIEYFGNKMITPEIGDLLSGYVLMSFR